MPNSPIILTLTGQDAITVALASNRQCELLSGDVWRTASGLPEANRMLRADPACVRLKAPPRVILEDVSKANVPLDADLLTLINNFLAEPDIDDLERKAIEIVKEHLS